MKTVVFFALWTVVRVPGCVADSLVDVYDPSSCGDWTTYGDSKCIKIVTTTVTQTQEYAKTICESFCDQLHSGSNAKLLTIKTPEEQKFLEHFLFTDNEVFDNVWLGLKKIGNNRTFQWNDGSEVLFSNWANQTITGDQHQCVVLESGQQCNSMGLWTRVNCRTRNIVVCEKTQTWSLETLTNAFLKNVVEQQLQKEEWNKEIKSLKKEISVLEQTNGVAVPIGFIYIELPGQAPPSTLWPFTNWTEVSSTYAGLFFRVAGGEAAPFGQIQEANTTRLEGVTLEDGFDSNEIIVPPDGSWSQKIVSGTSRSSPYYSLRFRLSTLEIRPRNQAVKIWKRIS